MRADGHEQYIGVRDAEARIAAGTAEHAGRRDGIPCVVEQQQAVYRDRVADIWINDRGVKGGKYGRPYEPNGMIVAGRLVRGRAQFHLVHQ